jgi:hypothetical protein
MNIYKKCYLIAAGLLLLIVGIFLLTADEKSSEVFVGANIPAVLANSELEVNFQKSSVDLNKILSGGPGKDGIPALTKPDFVSQQESGVVGDTQVIFVENNGEQKIYPYSILVWHEIVNDKVGGKPLAITFCPLCGSAIVFEREVEGQVLDFGVSGFLYESNLLMYSREESESLWSQSLGEAVVGQRTGQKLVHFPLQLMKYSEAIKKYPEARVLSKNTGHSRNYSGNPYSGYEGDEAMYFPVSVNDKRFPAKEVFYIISREGGSIAVRQNKKDGTYNVPKTGVEVTFNKGGVKAVEDGNEVPGYYEMWFSWATHNQKDGIVF